MGVSFTIKAADYARAPQQINDEPQNAQRGIAATKFYHRGTE
jgi:hypothetical protein